MKNRKFTKEEFNEIKSVQNLTTLKDKKIFIFRTESSGGYAFKNWNVILIQRRRRGLSNNQYKFLLTHELAHLEFKYTLSPKEVRNLYRSSNRIKGIINETMCDLRAARLVKLSDQEIKEYFERKSNDIKLCYRYGYFTGEVRRKFVEEFLRQGFNKKSFKERFIFNYNNFKEYGIDIPEIKLDDLEEYLHYYFDEFKI